MYKVLLLLVLLILLGLLVNNKEMFVSKKHKLHNCYHNTFVQSPLKSYKSLSKGWCSTGNYEEEYATNNDLTVYGGDSKLKCPPNSSRLSAKESASSKLKGWCS